MVGDIHLVEMVREVAFMACEEAGGGYFQDAIEGPDEDRRRK